MFPLIGYFRNSKLTRLKLKAAYLRRQIAPFHMVLSTLRAEGKNQKLVSEVLSDIQSREQVLFRVEKQIRGME